VNDDVAVLTELNRQFIEAFCKGSWEILEPILSPGFRYLDGKTGEQWELPRYIEDLRAHPVPTLVIDQVVIHIDGDAAVVSARTSVRPEKYNRYVDSYERRDGKWTCYHACVWPLPQL
jgi:hypothetical protein